MGGIKIAAAMPAEAFRQFGGDKLFRHNVLQFAFAELFALDINIQLGFVKPFGFHHAFGAVHLIINAARFALKPAVDTFGNRAVVQCDHFNPRAAAG